MSRLQSRIPTALALGVHQDETPPQRVAAYLVPNCVTNAPVSSFAVPVDKIERLTGLKFFPRQDLSE